MNLNHPKILEFGYIHRTLYFNSDLLALEATGVQIKATVPPDHPDLPLLREAYRLRRTEIREAVARKNEELQEQLAEKAKAEADAENQLIVKDLNRGDNEPRYSKR